MKRRMLILLLAFPGVAMAEWVEYAAQPNGDIHYYDSARVEREGQQVNVWSRIRYKTSVMGAASQQSRLKIHCTEGSESTLQSTFFSDRNWETPAMATNKKPKPGKPIKSGSAMEKLASKLCQN